MKKYADRQKGILGIVGQPLEFGLGALRGKATLEVAQRFFFCHEFLSLLTDLPLHFELNLTQLCKGKISQVNCEINAPIHPTFSSSRRSCSSLSRTLWVARSSGSMEVSLNGEYISWVKSNMD